MVGGLVQRYDSGGEEVYTSGTLRKAGGGGGGGGGGRGLLSRRGGGTLHERATL